METKQKTEKDNKDTEVESSVAAQPVAEAKKADSATPEAASVPPTSPPSPNQPQTPSTPQQKSHALAWVLGGCFALLIVFLAGLAILGWLAYREAKKSVEQYQPTIQGVQGNLDQFNKEAQEWQKKSQQLRDAVPDPKDMPNINMGDLRNMNVNMNDTPIQE